MAKAGALLENAKKSFADFIEDAVIAYNELTLEIKSNHLLDVAQILRDSPEFRFEMLMDLCGVDYSTYGVSEWVTKRATDTAFSRGFVPQTDQKSIWEKPRFAVVYHLLSLHYNHRVRLKVFVPEEFPTLKSVVKIWNSANWYEREAFDLFGIFFEEHPDLRRLLTDYGFIGHPLRKDFPLIGNVEMRYSADKKRVIYEPVTIAPRTLIPKTIEDDNRYMEATPLAEQVQEIAHPEQPKDLGQTKHG